MEKLMDNVETKWEKIEPSDAWDFKKEKELVAYFVDVEVEVGPNKSNLYNFRLENGDVVAVWGNTVLDIRFKYLRKGDLVKVVYLGDVKNPKTGRVYKNFEVYRQQTTTGFSEDEDIPILEEE